MNKELLAALLAVACATSAFAGIIKSGGSGSGGTVGPVRPTDPSGPKVTDPTVPTGQPCIFYDPANPNTRMPTGCIPKNV